MEDIVLISGGGSGLGYEMVKILLEKGFAVCNFGWGRASLEKVQKEFEGKKYFSYLGDVSNEEFVEKSITEISEKWNIKYLINNAGGAEFALPAQNTKSVVETNFKGLFGMIYLSTYVLRQMEKTGGKIVNIMSSAALRGNKEESAYCAAKWGQRGFTESLKTAYKGTNIKIMGVYPGGMNTQFFKNSRNYVSEEKQNTFISPKEVAETIIENAFNDKKLNVSDLVIEKI